MNWIGWIPPTNITQDLWLVLNSGLGLWLMFRVKRLERWQKFDQRHNGGQRLTVLAAMLAHERAQREKRND